MAALHLRQRRVRRWWITGLTLTAFAVFAVVFVAASSADNASGCDFAATGTTQSCSSPLTGSTFAGGDGNLLTSPTTFGTTDWQNVANRHGGTDNPSGSGDNSFGQGSKEDGPDVTTVTGSIPPNKSDLTRFYEADEFANGSNFLYLAWERTNVLGSANMDFEINQNLTANLGSPGPHTINRTAGDLLITFDFTNGGGKPTLGVNFWVTSGSSSQCLSANSVPCWGNHVNLNSTNSIGAVNNLSTVTDPIAPNAPRQLPALTFGEAAINLTAAGVFPPGTCEGFGSVFLKSRASSSFPAEVKDFVAPVPINISNCGALHVKKVTVPSGASQLFGYTTTGGLSPSTFNLTDQQTRDYTGLAAGTYTVTEGATAGWDLTSITCDDTAGSGDVPSATATFTVSPNSNTTCTFTNTEQLGAIKVTKTRKHAADGTGDHPQSGVSFTVNGVTKQTNGSGVACFDGLAFGSYTVHETVPTGYHVDANDKSVTVDNTATCSDATYVGETVSFHNTPLTDLTVSVNSQVDGGTSSTVSCTPAGPSGSSGANGDFSGTTTDLEPGTYTCTVDVDP